MSGATSPEAETIIRQQDTINRLMGQSASRIEQVQRSLDSAYAAQRRFEQAQTSINSAMERGRITQDRANQLLDLARQKYQQTGEAAQRFAVANDNATRGTRNLGQVIGQAGFQVQDFAVQVASGQSALTAFAQQAPQALGAFGTTGILLGVGVALGAIILRLVDATAAQRAFDDALKAAGDTYARNTQLAERWREGLESERNRVRDLTSAYESMNVAGREFERRRLEETRGGLRTQQQALERNTERELEDLRRLIDRQIDAAREATFRARQFDRNAPAVTVDPGIRQSVEALTALGEPGQRTAQQIEEVARRLAEASQNAGPFAEIMLDTAAALDRLIPGWRTLSEAVQRNQRDLDANAEAARRAGQSLSGLGGNAAGAAGQVDGLTASVARLRAQTDSMVGVENSAAIARAEQRAQALARGLGAAREFDAAEAQRQSSERYFIEQRRQDEERLQRERYSNDQIREELARTDEARRQSSNRRAELEAQNAARLRALEEAERTARRGATTSARGERREERLTERARRERDQLISSLDEEAAANIRLEESLRRIDEARKRNLLTEEEAARYSQEARDRREQEIVRANDKSDLDAAQVKQTTQLAEQLGSAFSSAFEDAITGASSFSDILKQLEQDLLRIITRTLVTQPLSQFLTGSVQSFLGGSGSGVAGALGSLGSMGGAEIASTGAGLLKSATAVAAVLHDGGIAGIDGGRRHVPMDVFLDAPRYHGGGRAGERPFANDEVPAILRRGEVVLNDRQQRAMMGGGTINQTVVIKTDDPGSFNRTRGQMAAQMRRDLGRAARNA